MQFHPDPDELKSYLRGRASVTVASAIKQHLLNCDECVGFALVEYDRLDRARKGIVNRKPPVRKAVPAVAAVVPPEPVVSTWRYAWAAIIPVTMAVGLLLQANTPTERPQPIAQMEAMQPAEPLRGMSNLPEEPKETVEAPRVSITRFLNFDRRQRAPVARPFVMRARFETSRVSLTPVLLPASELKAPLRNSNELQELAALSLVTSEPSLAPPPRKKTGLKRFMSALAAPFRRST
jgi:hypothetical protein